MKKLWLGAGALSIFFLANLGVTRDLEIDFSPSSPADVCDCGTICKMHVTCDVPKCNGRIAQQNENQNSGDSLSDGGDDSL